MTTIREYLESQYDKSIERFELEIGAVNHFTEDIDVEKICIVLRKDGFDSELTEEKKGLIDQFYQKICPEYRVKLPFSSQSRGIVKDILYGHEGSIDFNVAYKQLNHLLVLHGKDPVDFSDPIILDSLLEARDALVNIFSFFGRRNKEVENDLITLLNNLYFDELSNSQILQSLSLIENIEHREKAYILFEKIRNILTDVENTSDPEEKRNILKDLREFVKEIPHEIKKAYKEKSYKILKELNSYSQPTEDLDTDSKHSISTSYYRISEYLELVSGFNEETFIDHVFDYMLEKYCEALEKNAVDGLDYNTGYCAAEKIIEAFAKNHYVTKEEIAFIWTVANDYLYYIDDENELNVEQIEFAHKVQKILAHGKEPLLKLAQRAATGTLGENTPIDPQDMSEISVNDYFLDVFGLDAEKIISQFHNINWQHKKEGAFGPEEDLHQKERDFKVLYRALKAFNNHHPVTEELLEDILYVLNKFETGYQNLLTDKQRKLIKLAKTPPSKLLEFAEKKQNAENISDAPQLSVNDYLQNTFGILTEDMFITAIYKFIIDLSPENKTEKTEKLRAAWSRVTNACEAKDEITPELLEDIQFLTDEYESHYDMPALEIFEILSKGGQVEAKPDNQSSSENSQQSAEDQIDFHPRPDIQKNIIDEIVRSGEQTSNEPQDPSKQTIQGYLEEKHKCSFEIFHIEAEFLKDFYQNQDEQITGNLGFKLKHNTPINEDNKKIIESVKDTIRTQHPLGIHDHLCSKMLNCEWSSAKFLSANNLLNKARKAQDQKPIDFSNFSVWQSYSFSRITLKRMFAQYGLANPKKANEACAHLLNRLYFGELTNSQILKALSCIEDLPCRFELFEAFRRIKEFSNHIGKEDDGDLKKAIDDLKRTVKGIDLGCILILGLNAKKFLDSIKDSLLSRTSNSSGESHLTINEFIETLTGHSSDHFIFALNLYVTVLYEKRYQQAEEERYVEEDPNYQSVQKIISASAGNQPITKELIEDLKFIAKDSFNLNHSSDSITEIMQAINDKTIDELQELSQRNSEDASPQADDLPNQDIDKPNSDEPPSDAQNSIDQTVEANPQHIPESQKQHTRALEAYSLGDIEAFNPRKYIRYPDPVQTSVYGFNDPSSTYQKDQIFEQNRQDYKQEVSQNDQSNSSDQGSKQDKATPVTSQNKPEDTTNNFAMHEKDDVVPHLNVRYSQAKDTTEYGFRDESYTWQTDQIHEATRLQTDLSEDTSSQEDIVENEETSTEDTTAEPQDSIEVIPEETEAEATDFIPQRPADIENPRDVVFPDEPEEELDDDVMPDDAFTTEDNPIILPDEPEEELDDDVAPGKSDMEPYPPVELIVGNGTDPAHTDMIATSLPLETAPLIILTKSDIVVPVEKMKFYRAIPKSEIASSATSKNVYANLEASFKKAGSANQTGQISQAGHEVGKSSSQLHSKNLTVRTVYNSASGGNNSSSSTLTNAETYVEPILEPVRSNSINSNNRAFISAESLYRQQINDIYNNRSRGYGGEGENGPVEQTPPKAKQRYVKSFKIAKREAPLSKELQSNALQKTNNNSYLKKKYTQLQRQVIYSGRQFKNSNFGSKTLKYGNHYLYRDLNAHERKLFKNMMRIGGVAIAGHISKNMLALYNNYHGLRSPISSAHATVNLTTTGLGLLSFRQLAKHSTRMAYGVSGAYLTYEWLRFCHDPYPAYKFGVRVAEFGEEVAIGLHDKFTGFKKEFFGDHRKLQLALERKLISEDYVELLKSYEKKPTPELAEEIMLQTMDIFEGHIPMRFALTKKSGEILQENIGYSDKLSYYSKGNRLRELESFIVLPLIHHKTGEKTQFASLRINDARYYNCFVNPDGSLTQSRLISDLLWHRKETAEAQERANLQQDPIFQSNVKRNFYKSSPYELRLDYQKDQAVVWKMKHRIEVTYETMTQCRARVNSLTFRTGLSKDAIMLNSDKFKYSIRDIEFEDKDFKAPLKTIQRQALLASGIGPMRKLQARQIFLVSPKFALADLAKLELKVENRQAVIDEINAKGRWVKNMVLHSYYEKYGCLTTDQNGQIQLQKGEADPKRKLKVSQLIQIAKREDLKHNASLTLSMNEKDFLSQTVKETIPDKLVQKELMMILELLEEKRLIVTSYDYYKDMSKAENKYRLIANLLNQLNEKRNQEGLQKLLSVRERKTLSYALQKFEAIRDIVQSNVKQHYEKHIAQQFMKPEVMTNIPSAGIQNMEQVFKHAQIPIEVFHKKLKSIQYDKLTKPITRGF